MPVEYCVSRSHSSAPLVSEPAAPVRTIVRGTLGSPFLLSSVRRSFTTPPSAPSAKIAIFVRAPVFVLGVSYAGARNPAGCTCTDSPHPRPRNSRERRRRRAMSASSGTCRSIRSRRERWAKGSRAPAPEWCSRRQCARAGGSAECACWNAAAAWATVPSAVTSSRLLATLTLKPLPARYDSTAWACAPVGVVPTKRIARSTTSCPRIADCSAETSRRRNGTASRRGVDGGAAPKRVASRSDTAGVAVAAQLEACRPGSSSC